MRRQRDAIGASGEQRHDRQPQFRAMWLGPCISKQHAHEPDQRRHDHALCEESVGRLQVHGVAPWLDAAGLLPDSASAVCAESRRTAGTSSGAGWSSHSGEKVQRQIACRFHV